MNILKEKRMFYRFIFALLTASALLCAPLAAQAEPQLITIPLSRPGEPVKLEIEILSAHIEVIGEDRQDAAFEVSVVKGERKIITPSGTQSLGTGAYSLDIEEEDNTIDVDSDWRAEKVHIVARVPRRADLTLKTTNNGVILVNNIEGQLWLENTNGPITATHISGSVIADSVNQDINVEFDSVDGSEAMSFSSINGDLTIGWPANAGAELHIDSAEGEIYSDFEVTVKPSKPVITRENNRGGVEVRVDSVIVADVNGGGQVVRLKTLNGDIQINKSGG
ncbi:MAG: hypothetical protein HKO64_06990 [Xanthomonadales bacterium]|nr:hypothetical protein [Xanthomonadales bacterium]NNL95354.1 hypothetical protein [Xanthomonadales bacterium]